MELAPGGSFCENAVAPPIAAATFHPEGFSRFSHIKITEAEESELDNHRQYERAEASVRIAWSSRVLGFAKKGGKSKSKPRLSTALISPTKLERLISSAPNGAQAIKLIHQALGIEVSLDSLYKFIKRHQLVAPWHKDDPKVVQELVQRTSTQREAISVLKEVLDWSVSDSGLSAYMRRHSLTAPWQRQGPTQRRPAVSVMQGADSRTIQKIVGHTENATAAVERIADVLGRRTTPKALAKFLHRRGIKAPWQREHPRRDPTVVEMLVRSTKSPQDAVELLEVEMGWSTTVKNLRRFMNRHVIKAPPEWAKWTLSLSVLTVLALLPHVHYHLSAISALHAAIAFIPISSAEMQSRFARKTALLKAA